MRRVIFVNRFFFPDHSATSQLVSDLAFHLTESGREVLALTSSQVYDDPKAESDLGVYRAQFGLSACTTQNGCFTKVSQSGSHTKFPNPNPG